MNFIVKYYGWTSLIAVTCLLLLVYVIVTEKFEAEDTLTRWRRAESKLNRRAFLGSVIWVFMITVASFSEATLPLKEYFTEIGHENPMQAALACSLCYTLFFFCACDLVTTITVELRLRWVRTEVLNRGKK